MAEDAGKQHTIYEEVEFDDEEPLEELQPDFDEEEEEGADLDDYNKLVVETRIPNTLRDSAPPATIVERQAPNVDDFIRNFFIKHGFTRSLEAFQNEWFEKGGLGEAIETAPDLYVKAQQLAQENAGLTHALQTSEGIAQESKKQWDKFRKERDFHKMHHRRVVQERRRLLTDFERLKRHYEQYEPTLAELRHKYEVIMKEKMLMRLERDRIAGKMETLQEQLEVLQRQVDQKDSKASPAEATGVTKSRRRINTPWPEEEDLGEPAVFEPIKPADLKALKSFPKCHAGPIASLAFHPKLPVLATASDDHTWKLFSLPAGELVMSGEGHRDWVSGIGFHHRSNLIGTTSGDATVKIWDMSTESCRHTFTDHTQATWGLDFHPTHDFLVTASMDHTARVFDLASWRCRQTFRGHVDSVNAVCFQPHGMNVCTASGDKTVSLWDLRSGLCVQTFYGHSNAVNSCRFQRAGTVLVSCDADGLCKLWDIRMVCEFLQIDAGPHPVNAADFDGSGKALALASGDGAIKLFDLDTKTFVKNLDGHEDSAQDVRFDPQSKMLASCGSDSSVMLWQ
ncbi:unnamed protein product [Amoebophrya sp. A120]|nr:unnamed protein product [Amoebophrya sp. A120]|eukprot:GSA120T00002415001.1